MSKACIFYKHLVPYVGTGNIKFERKEIVEINFPLSDAWIHIQVQMSRYLSSVAFFRLEDLDPHQCVPDPEREGGCVHGHLYIFIFSGYNRLFKSNIDS